MFKSSFKPLPPTPMPDNPYKPVKSSVVFATAPIQGDSLSQYSGNNYVSLAPDYQAILSMIPDEEIALCLLRRAIPHTTLHPNVLKSFLLPFIHHDQVNNALKTVISENKSNPPT
jgi:hypothetical protein